MIDEELEFLIVQDVDGELSPEASKALHARIAGDATARSVWTEHARLRTSLRRLPTPSIDADWLEARIVGGLDEHERRAAPHRISRWAIFGPMAAAASLLIVLTLGVIFHRDDGDPLPAQKTLVASLPAAEVLSTGGAATVSVGLPANLSPQLITALFLAEQMPTQGRVIIRPAGTATGFD